MGGAWDQYISRVQAGGSDRREASLIRLKRNILEKSKSSLSSHRALIDGVNQSVIITNTDIPHEKTIYSMPGDDIRCGSTVEWSGSIWIVTEKDAASEVCTKATMSQCNYLLKWVDDSSVIHEQWCIVEDGTKYLTGEYEDRNFIITRGDSRLSMIIPKNECTIKFGRESRFLIYDPDDDKTLAYSLTKPLKVGSTYNGEGVYKFVLQEVVTTVYDNQEMGIADYYKYFDGSGNILKREPLAVEPSKCDSINSVNDSNGKRVWI